ncbi:MAG: hypothetical protein HUU10_15765 [Bacteroidetes bacterium]|nr:hypothetical protein [Bacteroidota bacterium]
MSGLFFLTVALSIPMTESSRINQPAINSNREDKQEFREWCLVELFGHQRVAGLVQPSLFPELLRVDVFEGESEKPSITRLINVKAVYALNPIEESVCRALASKYKPEPIQRWEISQLLPARGHGQNEDTENDDPFGNED